MQDTYSRSPEFVERMRDELRSQASWEAADAGRMSGHSSTPDLSQYDCLSDRSVVNEYLTREENRRAYESERR